MIDSSAPVLTIASPEAREYLHVESVLASFSAADSVSGLQSVSAALDGANGWQKFWSITLPAIAPITRYTVILAIIGSFQLIASIDALTGGGPENATMVTIKYIQTQGWEFLHFGYASAITLFLLVFLLVVTWLQLRSGRE